VVQFPASPPTTMAQDPVIVAVEKKDPIALFSIFLGSFL
jgi:hypothetical protein